MRALFLAAILVFSAPAAKAEAPAGPLAGLAGDYFLLDSETLERPFHIHVRYPEGYAESEETYPVVYLLDGDILFPILGAYHLLLHYDEPVPDAIIVGIAYGTFDPASGNHRATDYSAPPLDDGDRNGGAAAFQRFLKTQLIPAVEDRYKADPERRILVGQSRGAHFVLYSAFTDPDLFWGRILSNPSLEPNRQMFFAAPATARRDDLKLFFASGSRDWERLRPPALDWFAHWRERDDAPWRLRTVTMDGETHAAGITNVYRAGMIWLFESAAANE